MLLSVRRLVLSVFVVVVSGLVFASAPVLAAAPETPGPVTMGAPVGATKASVSGVLSPGAEGHPGTYEFLYKASKTECQGGSHAPGSPGMAFGFAHEEVAETLTGLQAHTEYTVCLLDRNSNGEETIGPGTTFTTALALEAPTTLSASSVAAGSAMLHGVLNPGSTGKAGSYEFLYRASGSECQGEGAVGGSTLGDEKEAVSGEVSRLVPDTLYTYCLLVRNEAGETMVSSPATFTTLTQVPTIGGEAVSFTGVTAVSVTAEVHTGGLDTTYGLQYGPTTAYGSQTSPATLGGTTVVVTVPIAGLSPDTEYHLRFVASNGDGSVQGQDMTVVTYSTEPEGLLPDSRTYEMVTPPENVDANVRVQGPVPSGMVHTFFPSEAAPEGNTVTYVADPTTGGNGNSNNSGGNQYLAKHLLQGGWRQENISKPNDLKGGYKAFSPDLSTGIVGGVSSEAFEALYTSGGEGNFSPVFGTPRFRENLNFVGPYQLADFRSTFVGASRDLSHVLFEANDDLLIGEGSLGHELENVVREETKKIIPLEEEAEKLQSEGFEEVFKEDPKKELKEHELIEKSKEIKAIEGIVNRMELYESADGAVSLVNVSPEGHVVIGAKFDGANPVSDDGTRVFWTSLESPKAVFVRIDGSKTVQVSAGSAKFEMASPDGEYAFYIEDGKLWRFDVDNETRMEIAGAAGGVQSVSAINETGESGAYVYFISQEALAGPHNIAGQRPVEGMENLYVAEQQPGDTGRETIVFVGALSSGEGTVQATPSGEQAAFTASENLTGESYAGEGSQEVYVFDAHEGSLWCASCRKQASGGYLPIAKSISEMGDRVFFDSSASLVSRDINGVEDVYEWERDGSGECSERTGCVYLISSGKGSLGEACCGEFDR